METGGTPVRIGTQSECWPLITTLWYLPLRKLRNRLRTLIVAFYLTESENETKNL